MAMLNLHDCVVPIYGCADKRPPHNFLGTGFRLIRPDLIVTARHVVSGFDLYAIGANRHGGLAVVDVFYSSNVSYAPDQNLDLAVIRLEPSEEGSWQCLGLRPEEYVRSSGSYGTPVATFGYPEHGSKGVSPRIMFGHVQRSFEYERDNWSYSALELSFPAFHGQSGSPILLNDQGRSDWSDKVVGVVTTSVYYEQDRGDGPAAVGSWAVGVSLLRYDLATWLQSHATQLR